MANFSYKAGDRNGDILSGLMEASNEDTLISSLKEKGLIIIDLKKTSGEKSKGISRNISFFDRIRTRDMVVFTRQFSTLISSGMSLVESLVVLESQASSERFKDIITQIRIDIESGHSLSEAMSKHKIFSRLYISLIRAGETGGVLDESMENLADFMEKDEKISLQVRNKTAYPKFVLGFALIITMVMILFLVPTFKDIYDDLGAELPALTKGVIWVGELFKNVFFYVGVIIVVVGGRFLFRRWRQTPNGSKTVDTIRIKVPKMGDIIKKLALSRFARYLGTLLRAGVPILSALDIVKGVTDNVLIDNAISDIKNNIRKGENISSPMSQYSVFPAMMVQMTSVGEKTGTLDTNLVKISDFYESEVENSLEILLTILEPIMLLVVALLVGIILISMYLPMFNIYQAM